MFNVATLFSIRLTATQYLNYFWEQYCSNSGSMTVTRCTWWTISFGFYYFIFFNFSTKMLKELSVSLYGSQPLTHVTSLLAFFGCRIFGVFARKGNFNIILKRMYKMLSLHTIFLCLCRSGIIFTVNSATKCYSEQKNVAAILHWHISGTK